MIADRITEIAPFTYEIEQHVGSQKGASRGQGTLELLCLHRLAVLPRSRLPRKFT